MNLDDERAEHDNYDKAIAYVGRNNANTFILLFQYYCKAGILLKRNTAKRLSVSFSDSFSWGNYVSILSKYPKSCKPPFFLFCYSPKRKPRGARLAKIGKKKYRALWLVATVEYGDHRMIQYSFRDGKKNPTKDGRQILLAE